MLKLLKEEKRTTATSASEMLICLPSVPFLVFSHLQNSEISASIQRENVKIECIDWGYFLTSDGSRSLHAIIPYFKVSANAQLRKDIYT